MLPARAGCPSCLPLLPARPPCLRCLAAQGKPVRRFLDSGRDKHGSQGIRAAAFERRSRHPRAARQGLPEVRQGRVEKGDKGRFRGRVQRLIWKDVWDWEKASSAWEEREKMEDWAVARKRTLQELRRMRSLWRNPVRWVQQWRARVAAGESRRAKGRIDVELEGGEIDAVKQRMVSGRVCSFTIPLGRLFCCK